MEKDQKQKLTRALLALLFLALILAAALHLMTRTKAEEGALRIDADGQTISLKLSQLPTQDVQGTTVNGKGEEKIVSGTGVSLAQLLTMNGLRPSTGVTVYSDDEFSAFLTPEEIGEEGRVWLMLEDDGSLRLVVFGDKDSKRNVKNVVRLEVL